MGVKVGAVSMTQHDHSATACRNVLTPHRLQSRNVCRSTHANAAAFARDQPSITSEIACTLRTWRASFRFDAIHRRSCAVWVSRVTATGDPISVSPGPNVVQCSESNHGRAVNQAPVRESPSLGRTSYYQLV